MGRQRGVNPVNCIVFFAPDIFLELNNGKYGMLLLIDWLIVRDEGALPRRLLTKEDSKSKKVYILFVARNYYSCWATLVTWQVTCSLE